MDSHPLINLLGAVGVWAIFVAAVLIYVVMRRRARKRGRPQGKDNGNAEG